MEKIEIPKDLKFLIYVVGFVLIFAVVFSGIQLINPEIEMEVSGKCNLGDMNIDYVEETFVGAGNLKSDIFRDGKKIESKVTKPQIDYIKDVSCEGVIKYKGPILALNRLTK